MTDRHETILAFLDRAGWADAARVPLAGDASTRRYERLTFRAKRAVLMDARPERGENTERFAQMGRWLIAHGYSAPMLIAEDHVSGLLLLEDLGDALVARLLSADPAYEDEIYTVATDLLSDLHRASVPGFVDPLDGPALAELTKLTPEWYLRALDLPTNAAAESLPSIVLSLFDAVSDGRRALALRDFHAENLIWLPQREGLARLGLLDFQDAVVSHPAYDLVSLLQDARRDVSPQRERQMISRYVATNALDGKSFAAIYALLGAQRALRIIGVFARLARRDGRMRYLDYLPRVWGTLERNLKHPALFELSRVIGEGLPPPTPDRIARMKELACTRAP